jgi:hypothetical protein
MSGSDKRELDDALARVRDILERVWADLDGTQAPPAIGPARDGIAEALRVIFVAQCPECDGTGFVHCPVKGEMPCPRCEAGE